MQQKGFFASLFDLSFDSLITTRIIKVLYVLAILLIGLMALGMLVSVLGSDTSGGVEKLLVAILVPVGALFYLVWTRVMLEFVIAVFKIMDNTQRTADGAGAGAGAPTV